jgi:glucose-1-phosphate adenylyltransferase
MDLLDPNSGIDLKDRGWKIYARNMAEPPHFIGDNAKIFNSVISEGCLINGTVENSVIFQGCTIEAGAVIKDSIIMPNAVVKAGAVVQHAIIAWGAEVGEAAKIGSPQTAPVKGEWQIAVVGPAVSIGKGKTIEAGKMMGKSGEVIL